MSPLRWIRDWWWARQRAIDLEILWPSCRDNAPDLDRAKAAFAVHAFNDPAWIGFYGRERLASFIDGLE
ncbi:hypothetical protein [Vitreimonas flagellata]|uniref:hypothetical protein n=1 Tax=Vitreimonas flagellata TaxID=2560861 RepID=UPI001074F520|nr:hypothetical protein [Vitreimonas flagellata]